MLYLNSFVFEEGNLRGALRYFDNVKNPLKTPKQQSLMFLHYLGTFSYIQPHLRNAK